MQTKLPQKADDLLESLTTQFSLRKLFIIFSVLFYSIGILIIYENYTGHFKLAKIDKSLDLVNKLVSIYEKPLYINTNIVTSIGVDISNELRQFIKHSQTPFNLPEWLLKSYAAFGPWMLACLFSMPGKTIKNEDSIGVMLLFAIFYTVIGAYLPTFNCKEINYLVYPFGAYFINTVALGLIQWKKIKKVITKQ